MEGAGSMAFGGSGCPGRPPITPWARGCLASSPALIRQPGIGAERMCVPVGTRPTERRFLIHGQSVCLGWGEWEVWSLRGSLLGHQVALTEKGTCLHQLCLYLRQGHHEKAAETSLQLVKPS